LKSNVLVTVAVASTDTDVAPFVMLGVPCQLRSMLLTSADPGPDVGMEPHTVFDHAEGPTALVALICQHRLSPGRYVVNVDCWLGPVDVGSYAHPGQDPGGGGWNSTAVPSVSSHPVSFVELSVQASWYRPMSKVVTVTAVNVGAAGGPGGGETVVLEVVVVSNGAAVVVVVVLEEVVVLPGGAVVVGVVLEVVVVWGGGDDGAPQSGTAKSVLCVYGKCPGMSPFQNVFAGA
jgi:hypothetical protein